MNYRNIKDFSSDLSISTLTCRRITATDSTFPKPMKEGRQVFVDAEALQSWLKSRSDRPEDFRDDDVVIPLERVLGMVGRGKVWLWMKVAEKNLNRVNLSPDRENGRMRNFFIEREIREKFPVLVSQNDDSKVEAA